MELELNLNPGQTRMGKVCIKRNDFPNVSYILVPLQYLLQNPVYYRNSLQVSMVTFELICFFLELEQEVSQILAKFDQSMSIFVQKLASSSAYNTNDYKPSTLCKNCRFVPLKKPLQLIIQPLVQQKLLLSPHHTFDIRKIISHISNKEYRYS